MFFHFWFTMNASPYTRVYIFVNTKQTRQLTSVQFLLVFFFYFVLYLALGTKYKNIQPWMCWCFQHRCPCISILKDMSSIWGKFSMYFDYNIIEIILTFTTLKVVTRIHMHAYTHYNPTTLYLFTVPRTLSIHYYPIAILHHKHTNYMKNKCILFNNHSHSFFRQTS